MLDHLSIQCADVHASAAQAAGEGFRESQIAFAASDRAAVRAFFESATGAGAEVLHEPRL